MELQFKYQYFRTIQLDSVSLCLYLQFYFIHKSISYQVVSPSNAPSPQLTSCVILHSFIYIVRLFPLSYHLNVARPKVSQMSYIMFLWSPMDLKPSKYINLIALSQTSRTPCVLYKAPAWLYVNISNTRKLNPLPHIKTT